MPLPRRRSEGSALADASIRHPSRPSAGGRRRYDAAWPEVAYVVVPRRNRWFPSRAAASSRLEAARRISAARHQTRTGTCASNIGSGVVRVTPRTPIPGFQDRTVKVRPAASVRSRSAHNVPLRRERLQRQRRFAPSRTEGLVSSHMERCGRGGVTVEATAGTSRDQAGRLSSSRQVAHGGIAECCRGQIDVTHPPRAVTGHYCWQSISWQGPGTSRAQGGGGGT